LIKVFFIFLTAMMIIGCSQVSHMDQLLTLKNLADEQTRMGQFVEAQDAKFEQMLSEEKAGTLDHYANKRKILRMFGDPIYVQSVKRDDRDLEVWLYRYAAEFFNSEKIYLYFDSDENLVESEYVEAKHGEIEQKTEKEDGRQEN